MQRVPTEWGAVCPPPAGLCLRVGGRAGSRTHVGLAAPREASGQGQDLSPGVLPVSLSHHKQKGTLVAGRPGGVQRWRRSRGSEKEPMRSEAQADSPRPLACPLDLSPLEWPDCDQAHLLRQQKEPDPRGPACTPQPGQAPVSGSPQGHPPPTSLASQAGPPRVSGSAPQVPQTHGHTGVLAELYWAPGSEEEQQPRGTEFPLVFLKLGLPKAVAITAPGSPQEAGRPSVDLFPSGRQEGGGREMRSGLNTQGGGPGSGAWAPTAGSKEPQPWWEDSSQGGGAGNPEAGHGVGSDRESSEGRPLTAAGSGQCSTGQCRGAIGMPPPGTKAWTSWCPQAWASVPQADGKVAMRTYPGGAWGPGEEGSLAQEARPHLCPQGVGREHEKPSSQDGDRLALAGHPRTDSSLSGRPRSCTALETKLLCLQWPPSQAPGHHPQGQSRAPQPGLPSGILI